MAGRPKSDDETRRTAMLVYLTQKEKEALREHCTKQHISISAYVRKEAFENINNKK